MYYSHSCTYCTKVFYVYSNHKEEAAKILYEGIKTHLIEYDEDHKEYEMDDLPEIEINDMYAVIVEYNDPPAGGYELK